ncbi:MAG: hypothetical protein CBB70_10580 [Planctomycetaceae bacterium TMED10]|nr:MAG: hypothetical protein CBB70_10580 [Planctomycetaceae bacterium TMED10]
MKIFYCAMLAVGLGFGLAFLRTISEFGWTVEAPVLAGTQQVEPLNTGPKVVVSSDTHAFDRMYQNQTGTHTFVLRNEGLSDLKIIPGKPSCKCTVSKVSRRTIPPGETAKVTLTWKTGKSKGKYRKRAPIKTNDPAQASIQLKIEGTVTPDFAFQPPTLFASGLANDMEKTLEAKLFFYGKNVVELLGEKLSREDLKDFLKVDYLPMPSDQITEPYATTGYTIRVNFLPGMPTGNFHDAIIFQTDPSMAQPVRLNVNGTVRKPVNLFGPQLDRETQILNLGKVAAGNNRQVRLLMQVAGRYRDEVKVELTSSEPPGIGLETGPDLLLAKGTLRQFPLIFTVPKDAKPGTYGIGSHSEGKIILATGHPDYPEIELRVKLEIDPQENTSKPASSSEESPVETNK